MKCPWQGKLKWMKVISVAGARESVAEGLRGKSRSLEFSSVGAALKMIPDTKATTLMGIMQERIIPDSIVYTDTYRSYNVLDVAEFKHYRIIHSKRFVKKHRHINGIENFWNQAKRHLRKFNGVPRQHFPLFLKECEWRFNFPNPQRQFAQLKQWVKPFMK
jgi:transposase